MKLDYIIVGQGIAGTLLHYLLEKAGQKAIVVDRYKMSSSRISSGIMNPLTGRRYVKSWMYDDLVEAAIPTYESLGELLGMSFVSSMPIIRALPDRKAEMEWDYRSSLPEYEKYIGDKIEWDELEGHIKEDVPFVMIKNGYHLHMPELVAAYRTYLEEKDLLVEAKVDYKDIQIQNDHVQWQRFSADHIVFCEGPGSSYNPYFDFLPFNLSKGEAMLMEVPFHLRRVVKKKGFLVPWEKDKMWVGSANFWNFEDGHSTKTGEKRILRQLDQMYEGPYKPLQSLAAIKPTVKDRKPFLGTHPTYANIHIFNGLGTKGASLGPYFAAVMADYLINDKPLNKTVDIKRFTTES